MQQQTGDFPSDEDSPASLTKEGQAVSSEDESGVGSTKQLDLPSELLLQTLHYLEESCPPWDRTKFLMPATQVSRRWHELSRPLMFKTIRFTPSKAAKLLPVLNSTRNWARYVKSLRISFSVHYNQSCTPTLLNLIAACPNLERLDLVGCGKPVYKSFLAQSGSVLFAENLYKVLAGLKHLVLTGGRKKGSTGLDAAKLTSFLLPNCTSLECLERGEISFQTVQCATLQPMLDPASPANFNTATPLAGSVPMPSLSHLRSLTLASSVISSRAFTQALSIVHPAVIEELVIRANDAPTRRYFDDMIKTFGPNLRSLKIDLMFPSHRLYQVFDAVPASCPKLQILDLRGPLCTDAILKDTTLQCPHLYKLVLMHNRAISHTGLGRFLLMSPAASHEPYKQLILDDLLAPDWTPWIDYCFRRAIPAFNSSWLVYLSDHSWRNIEADDLSHGGHRRIMHAAQPLNWIPAPLEALQVSMEEAVKWATTEYMPPDEETKQQEARSSMEEVDAGSLSIADRLSASIRRAQAALGSSIEGANLDMEAQRRFTAEQSAGVDDEEEQEPTSSEESETDSDGEGYESDWEVERLHGIPPIRRVLDRGSFESTSQAAGFPTQTMPSMPRSFFELPQHHWFNAPRVPSDMRIPPYPVPSDHPQQHQPSESAPVRRREHSVRRI